MGASISSKASLACSSSRYIVQTYLAAAAEGPSTVGTICSFSFDSSAQDGRMNPVQNMRSKKDAIEYINKHCWRKSPTRGAFPLNFFHPKVGVALGQLYYHLGVASFYLMMGTLLTELYDGKTHTHTHANYRSFGTWSIIWAGKQTLRVTHEAFPHPLWFYDVTSRYINVLCFAGS